MTFAERPRGRGDHEKLFLGRAILGGCYRRHRRISGARLRRREWDSFAADDVYAMRPGPRLTPRMCEGRRLDRHERCSDATTKTADAGEGRPPQPERCQGPTRRRHAARTQPHSPGRERTRTKAPQPPRTRAAKAKDAAGRRRPTPRRRLIASETTEPHVHQPPAGGPATGSAGIIVFVSVSRSRASSLAIAFFLRSSTPIHGPRRCSTGRQRDHAPSGSSFRRGDRVGLRCFVLFAMFIWPSR